LELTSDFWLAAGGETGIVGIDELDIKRDANLVIQRVLEFGDWDEFRWLFELYGAKRIRKFIRAYGERWLKPVSFNYWRKLVGIRQWKKSPFSTPKRKLWVH
jgi:squalene cyclase